MSERLRRLRWNIIAPVALLAAAIAGVAWFDLTSGDEAEPEPYLGALGTPVRGTFVPPTATPPGARPTPRSTVTVPLDAPGTPAERDQTRRNDLLVILGAFEEVRRREGEYPSTNGNLQSLCRFKEVDVGCVLRTVMDADPPDDPLGNENGYWYESDGSYLKLYAALEEPIPDDQVCPTDNIDLLEKPYRICVQAP